MAATWFDLVSHLETFLAAKVAARVSQGYNRGEVYPAVCPAIRLYRRGEPELDIWIRPKGTLEVIAELWVENEDPDPKAANAALADLEEEFRKALKAWPENVMASLKLKITDMRFAGISGDGENYRPHAAAFYAVVVKWAK